jgi:hypothetical protein
MYTRLYVGGGVLDTRRFEILACVKRVERGCTGRCMLGKCNRSIYPLPYVGGAVFDIDVYTTQVCLEMEWVSRPLCALRMYTRSFDLVECVASVLSLPLV